MVVSIVKIEQIKMIKRETMMNAKNFKRKLMATIILLLVLICSFPFFGFTYLSAGTVINLPNIYKDIATNFFKAQYEQEKIEYNELSVALESDLYDSNEDVVAKALVMQRDDCYDYVILNIATSQIDEFAFDDATAIDRFSNQVYYTGLLDYYTKEDNAFKSLNTNEIFSKSSFETISYKITEKLSKFKKNASRRYRSNNLALPNFDISTGDKGFYTWTDIDNSNIKNGYEFSDAQMLFGIYPSGIGDSDLEFVSQSKFNSHFGTNNSCGPTALTNMCIWFQWSCLENSNNEVNALKNNDIYDTFDRFRVLTNHSSETGTSRSNYVSAMKAYSNEQGYNYRIKSGINTYSEFKENIDNMYPILTSINLANGSGHAVVTVGYQEYVQSYKVLWITKYRYTRYLRIIDGWSTSNSSVYIDLNGYSGDISGISFVMCR